MEDRKFSIAQVEQLSGVRAVTVRAWEKRYGAVSPIRSANNCRLYSFSDLRKIMCFAVLSQSGYTVKRLSGECEEWLFTKSQQVSTPYGKWHHAVNELLFALYDGYAAVQAEQRCRTYLQQFGPNQFINQVVWPFLLRSHLMFRGSRSTNEHLLVTATRKSMHGCIEQLKPVDPSLPVVLLYLQGTQQLDLGLILVYYQLRSAGVNAVYVGNDITLQNLQEILDTCQPACTFTYGDQYLHDNVPDICRKLTPGLERPVMVFAPTRFPIREARLFKEYNAILTPIDCALPYLLAAACGENTHSEKRVAV